MYTDEELRHGESIAEDFLAHYGVPGMKWGVRRARSSINNAYRSEKKSIRKAKRANMVSDVKNLGKGVKRQVKTAVKQPLALRGTKGARRMDRRLKQDKLDGLMDRVKSQQTKVDLAKRREAADANKKQSKKNLKNSKKAVKKDYLNDAGKLDEKTTKAYESNLAKNNGNRKKAQKATDKQMKSGEQALKNKYKKKTQNLKHGELIMDQFLAHYGELKSEGGVTHDKNDTLAHYGVLGMKWGVRRGKGSVKASRKEKKNPKASKLSDSELRSRINRLQMEKQYKQLTTKDKSAATKFVSDVIRESAKSTASSYVSKAMKTGIEAGIDRAKKRPRQLKMKI